MTNKSNALKLSDLPESQTLDYGSLEDAFPNVSSMLKRPFGDRVLVQIRSAMGRTKFGFILPHETQDTEQWNTQVAKVIALGPVAFKNRDTLQPWPEGAWVEPGMYVRCPKYGGDRWDVQVPGRERSESAIFALFRDVDLGGEVDPADALTMVAYLKA